MLKTTITAEGKQIKIVTESVARDKVTDRPHTTEALRRGLMFLTKEMLVKGKSFLYIKIDMRKLKHFNDNYSFETGNTALRTYDAALEERIRTQIAQITGIDVFELHRMQSGGDEWVCCVYGDTSALEEFTNNLDSIVEDVPFEFEWKGETVTESLNAEYGYSLIDGDPNSSRGTILQQVREYQKELVEAVGISDDKFDLSGLLFFLAAKEVYTAARLHGDFKLHQKKDLQRFGEVLSANDIFKRCYKRLLEKGVQFYQNPSHLEGVSKPPGKLVPLNSTEPGYTIYTPEGITAVVAEIQKELTALTSNRTNPVLSAYFMQYAIRIGEIKGKIMLATNNVPELSQADIDLMGISEELAEGFFQRNPISGEHVEEDYIVN
jgi:GGDEF domain-containing protein